MAKPSLFASWRTRLGVAWRRLTDREARGAQEAILKELFYDMYRRRGDIYKLNFFRGVFFGLGSVIGGTIVVALLIWLLTLVIGLPVIGDWFDGIKNSLQSSR